MRPEEGENDINWFEQRQAIRPKLREFTKHRYSLYLEEVSAVSLDQADINSPWERKKFLRKRDRELTNCDPAHKRVRLEFTKASAPQEEEETPEEKMKKNSEIKKKYCPGWNKLKGTTQKLDAVQKILDSAPDMRLAIQENEWKKHNIEKSVEKFLKNTAGPIDRCFEKSFGRDRDKFCDKYQNLPGNFRCQVEPSVCSPVD